MDNQTRIGLGSGAVGVVVTLGQPLLGWWVAGPVMAGCALVAAWGFWPLVKDAPIQMPFNRRIPLAKAARIAYEKTQDKVVSGYAEGLSRSRDDILTWYCNALIGRHHGTLAVLRGVHPPSQVPEELDMITLSNYDFEVENGSVILKSRTGEDRYENLTIDKKELQAAIAEIAEWGG
jgi:hypothetical protein